MSKTTIYTCNECAKEIVRAEDKEEISIYCSIKNTWVKLSKNGNCKK